MVSHMPSLQIRDLPDDVYAALAWRAERAGRSLAQQALAELRAVSSRSDRSRRLRLLEQLSDREAPDAQLPTPEELIRKDRSR